MIEIGKISELYAVQYDLGDTDQNPIKFMGIVKGNTALRMVYVYVVSPQDQKKLGLILSSSRCCVANSDGRLISIFKLQQSFFNGLTTPTTTGVAPKRKVE